MTDREEKLSVEDAEIEFMNKKRNISFELSEEEKLLYTYSQTITHKLLQSMYEKYLEAQKHEEPIPSLDPSPHFDEVPELVDDLPALTRK